MHSIKVIELIMFFTEEHLRKTSLGMHYFQVEVLWLCLRTTWSSFKYPNRRSCFISSSAGFEAISWVNSPAEDLLYLQSYKTKRSWRLFYIFRTRSRTSMWLQFLTFYLSVNETFMTSSVVLCDFPNTSNWKLKTMNGTKGFG